MKFRLQKARRRGEAVAKEHGFRRFPVDPFFIAEKSDIEVLPKPPDKKGVSGGIVFSEENVGIFYATGIASEGFHRFTVGHELGHYFLEGHPEEIMKIAPLHVSRAGFTQGNNSIEIEADHFASGLLMPTHLVKKSLERGRIGLAGIEALAKKATCSLTAAAIRAAECCPYPAAVIVSVDDTISYGFLSDSFRGLGKLSYLKKGEPLPNRVTRSFNAAPSNLPGSQACGETSVLDWFDGPHGIVLDEEVISLGGYGNGYTLAVLSSEALSSDPEDDTDEESKLIESYTPKFAYGR